MIDHIIREQAEQTKRLPESSILEVKHLSIYYGDKQAVKDVNMNIEKHAVTALIGPSGCGKSTFLRQINRMNDAIASARSEERSFMKG